jgi:hypothetical protein
MNEEIRFEPTPETERLCSDQPTIIVDMVVRHYPPGTPAPARADRPHLPGRNRTRPPDNSSLPPGAES